MRHMTMDLRKKVRTTIHDSGCHHDKSAESLEVDRTGGEGVKRFLDSLDEPLLHASTISGMGGIEVTLDPALGRPPHNVTDS